mgnify:CR=1 FL=1
MTKAQERRSMVNSAQRTAFAVIHKLYPELVNDQAVLSKAREITPLLLAMILYELEIIKTTLTTGRSDPDPFDIESLRLRK